MRIGFDLCTKRRLIPQRIAQLCGQITAMATPTDSVTLAKVTECAVQELVGRQDHDPCNGHCLGNQQVEVKWSPSYDGPRNLDDIKIRKDIKEVLWQSNTGNSRCGCGWDREILFVSCVHTDDRTLYAFGNFRTGCVSFDSDEQGCSVYLANSVIELYEFCMNPDERADFERTALNPASSLGHDLEPYLIPDLVRTVLAFIVPIFALHLPI